MNVTVIMEVVNMTVRTLREVTTVLVIQDTHSTVTIICALVSSYPFQRYNSNHVIMFMQL